VWLDASDTGTITSSGGDVSQWSDKSVNGRNFTQSSATAKPKTGTRTLNGKNVIDFDGSNDFLSCPSSTALFNYFHNSTGATLFIVGIVDDTATLKMILNNEGGTSANNGFRIRISATEQDNIIIRRGVSGTSNAAILDNITLTGGSGFYLTNKFDAGNATAANRLKISLNGGAFLGSNVDTGSASASNATYNLHLGIEANSLTSPWNGAFGEIIMYSGILSAGDITATQSYLATKWGI
jgi:hypothetical protein